MTKARTVRLRSLQISRRAVAITAAVLALMITAMSAVSAVPCFEFAESPAAEHVALLSHTSESTPDDCEEKALFVVNIPKTDDAKHPVACAQPAVDGPGLRVDFLNQSTRGAILLKDKAPLFLQTGRLRI